MQKFSLILVVIAMLAGCSTNPVHLKHSSTGKVVKCGPYFYGLAADFEMEGIAMRESQCIKDYQRQGYERAPGG